MRSLNLTHSLSPPPRGGNPLKLKRSISGSLGPRSSTPIGRRGAPPRSHWPPSAASVPFPGSAWAPPARWRTPRGVIGQFRSLKSRQNGTSFAPGVSPRGIPRELPGGVKFPGKPLICSTTEDKVFGHSLGKLWSSRRAAPFLPPNFLSPEWLHYAPDMFSSSAAVGIEESLSSA